MSWDDEAVQAYLRSLRDSVGLPSQKELDCLERIKIWEGLMVFCKEIKGSQAGRLCHGGG